MRAYGGIACVQIYIHTSGGRSHAFTYYDRIPGAGTTVKKRRFGLRQRSLGSRVIPASQPLSLRTSGVESRYKPPQIGGIQKGPTDARNLRRAPKALQSLQVCLPVQRLDRVGSR